MMKLYNEILANLPDGKIITAKIGLRWTIVVAETEHGPSCGLASTLDSKHDHKAKPTIPLAGNLASLSGLEMARWIKSETPTQRSLGCAAINALLPKHPAQWVTENAVHLILRRGKGKKVVLIGRFPFVPYLREELEDFHVIDQHPLEEDLPPEATPKIIPSAQVVAITGMTFLNHTLSDILALCSPNAFVIILGPTTPLSQTLYSHGVDVLAGAVVDDIPAVIRTAGEGGNFSQVHRAGVRLILQTPTTKRWESPASGKQFPLK